MIKVTFEETLVIGTRIMNVQEKMVIQKYLREGCYHRIECTVATFLTAFM